MQSDDHGQTWYESGRLPGGTNEATVVELTDGSLLRNDRASTNQELRRRAVSTSPDQGITWTPYRYAPELIDPICEASITRYLPADNASGDRTLLFANPADVNRRANMTVRISYDDGATWTASKTVFRGPAAYSSLSVMPGGTITLLYEGGVYNTYDTIMFASFNMKWSLTAEPDLDDLIFSEGSLSPVFRGDVGDYRLSVYSGAEQLTVTPVSSNSQVTITVNGEPAAPGSPKTIGLNGLDTVRVEARLAQRVRQYTIHIDRTRQEPELLLHWDFDHTDGGGITDLTGKGHTGLLHNGAELRPGVRGQAVYLNGKRSSAEITNEEDLHSGTGDFSFSVWVKPEVFTQQRHIVYWYGQAGKGSPQWWLAVEKNGVVRMNMSGLPSGLEFSSVTPPGLVKAGQWAHLVAVREGQVIKVYVNGELGSTSTKFDPAQMNVTNRNLPPLIGFDKGTAANRDFQGWMDDLRVYKNALNAAEVRALYFSADTTKPVTQASVSPAAPNGKNGWYTTDVSVTLSVYDDFSGAEGTEYRLNGGSWTAYTGTFSVSAEGMNALEYRSTDRAGNVEEPKRLTLKIDKTAPRLSVMPDPSELWPPNHGWVPVKIKLEASDDASGIDRVVLTSITSNEPGGGSLADQIQEAEFGSSDTDFLLRAERNGDGSGRVYTIVYTATDQAGNTTAGTAGSNRAARPGK
ncbi:cadherin-like beta sandwich domain-containing protein [Paenibacillus sp. P25]|nr:cadherin-like beta sandwich domain-containing protein [Paenibacillus sp. P25]